MKQIDFKQDLLPLKDKIYRMGLRITLNAQEAEDLTQDTLIKAWNQREQLAKVNNIEAFCITICRNMALDRVARCEHATLSVEAEQPETIDSALAPDEKLELAPTRDEVRSFFVRVKGNASDTAMVKEQFGDVEIITVDGLDNEFGFITDKMTEEAFDKAAANVDMISRIRIDDTKLQ